MENTSECKIVKRSVEKHEFNSTNYFLCETHDRKIYTSREFDQVNECSKGREERL